MVAVLLRIKKWIFNTASSFDKFLIYKNIIKMNLDLMVFILDNLHKIKDGAYVINLDEYSDIGTHWVALYVSKASP